MSHRVLCPENTDDAESLEALPRPAEMKDDDGSFEAGSLCLSAPSGGLSRVPILGDHDRLEGAMAPMGARSGLQNLFGAGETVRFSCVLAVGK